MHPSEKTSIVTYTTLFISCIKSFDPRHKPSRPHNQPDLWHQYSRSTKSLYPALKYKACALRSPAVHLTVCSGRSTTVSQQRYHKPIIWFISPHAVLSVTAMVLKPCWSHFYVFKHIYASFSSAFIRFPLWSLTKNLLGCRNHGIAQPTLMIMHIFRTASGAAFFRHLSRTTESIRIRNFSMKSGSVCQFQLSLKVESDFSDSAYKNN